MVVAIGTNGDHHWHKWWVPLAQIVSAIVLWHKWWWPRAPYLMKICRPESPMKVNGASETIHHWHHFCHWHQWWSLLCLMDDVHLSTARHFRYELRRKIFSSNLDLERGRCAAHHNYYWLCIRVIIITICVNDHWREWCHCCQWRHDSVAIAHWHHQLSSFILANKSPLNGVIGRPFKWNHWWPIAIWCTIGTIWCITIGINGLPLVPFLSPFAIGTNGINGGNSESSCLWHF